MFSHTNLNLYAPDFLIHCNTLTYSNEIYQQMRYNGIERSYVYAIAINEPTQKFSYKIIKIGRSSPNPGDGEVDIGERIARQLCHIQGWTYYNNNPISSHGQDFLNAIKRNIKNGNLPKNFNKDMITVGIWDITAKMPAVKQVAVTNEFMATCYAESELAHQFKQHNMDNLPICNFVDPSRAKVYQGYISKSIGAMFGWT